MDDEHPRWSAGPADYERIWAHLTRQQDLDPRHHVRLSDGRVLRVGADAEGEGN